LGLAAFLTEHASPHHEPGHIDVLRTHEAVNLRQFVTNHVVSAPCKVGLNCRVGSNDEFSCRMSLCGLGIVVAVRKERVDVGYLKDTGVAELNA
jgi:hypothetical protein